MQATTSVIRGLPIRRATVLANKPISLGKRMTTASTFPIASSRHRCATGSPRSSDLKLERLGIDTNREVSSKTRLKRAGSKPSGTGIVRAATDICPKTRS